MEIFGDKGTTKRETLQFPREKVIILDDVIMRSPFHFKITSQFRRGQTESYFITGDDVGIIKGRVF